jgi:multidrug efflux pump
MVDTTLNDAFGQRQVATIYNPLNQYRVVMEAAPEYWQSPDTLKDVHVVTADGDSIPLAAFSRYEPTSTPLAVNHQGQFAASTISFNLPPGVSLSQATRAIDAEMSRIGVPPSIHGTFAGSARAFQRTVDANPVLIATAILTIYIVLGMLYESYVHPLTILSTLPSAGVGALLALMSVKMEFSLMALIGVILLIGIVKKNAIMMIDVALDTERRLGKPPQEAIFEACLLRFRPIMMTTLAALLGALPLAVGYGYGAELRQPLGISIMGGLILSQLLTLYTTPVVYLYLDRFRLWCLRLRGRRPVAAAAPTP